MAACRGCGAPVEWVRARKKDGTTGKMSIPLVPMPAAPEDDE